MKNKLLRNTLKAVLIYPVVLFIGLPFVYFFNDLSFKESYKDVFKGFWN